MNKEDIKKVVMDCIKNGLDRDDFIKFAKAKFKDKKDCKKIIDYYDFELTTKEKMNLGFFQRRRLKKFLKGYREAVTKTKEALDKINNETKVISKAEKKNLEELKETMHKAILGDPEKTKMGLCELFEVRNEDGKLITKKQLKECSVEEVESLLSDLLDQLEKEI